MNHTVGYNVHNTVAFAPRTMAYFKRHHLLDMYRELFVVLGRDQPRNVRKYVAKALPRIGRRYATTRTTVLAPRIFSALKMAKKYGRMYNTPVVQYTKQRKPNDAAEVLRKFKKFAKYHSLDGKHLITFNFPGDRGEVVDCIDHDFAPTNVVEIIPGPQVPFKTRAQCRDEERAYIADFRQVKEYFPERAVDLHFGDDDELCEGRYSAVRSLRQVCQHLQRIVRRPLSQMGDHRYEGRLQPPGRWHPRVVLIGRRGAGRKTQAALLARELGLVFIDVDSLVLKKIQEPDSAIGKLLATREKRHNRGANPYIVSIVQKRIMKPDCLHNGYVVVGFGTCVEDLRLMEQTFAVQPNRIIFLHCRERVCQRRLRKQIEEQEQLAGGAPYTREAYANPRRARHVCHGVHLMMEPAEAFRCIDKEHVHYNLNIREMVEHIGWRREVRHVNGTRSVLSVHEDLKARTSGEELEVRGEDATAGGKKERHVAIPMENNFDNRLSQLFVDERSHGTFNINSINPNCVY